jgi:hypothetical protein
MILPLVAIPQNNADLNAKKGPGRDVRHRFALSSVYDVPIFLRFAGQNGWTWSRKTGIYPPSIRLNRECPSRSPFLATPPMEPFWGKNPKPANVTGQHAFGPGTHTAAEWFNPAAFVAPPDSRITGNFSIIR